MRDLVAYVFLVMFCASIVFTYFAIRLGWLKLWIAGLVGLISSMAFMFMFSALKGNSLLQAIVVSIASAIMFTAAAVSIGVYFETNSGKRDELPPRQ